MGRASRRRSRPHRRAARCLNDRSRDRRADVRLDRRAAAAEGLSRAAARDLRQARHPADLRRSDYRLRPARHRVRGRALRRAAGYDHVREGRDLRHRSDGRRDPAQGHLRRLHARTRARDRTIPRLHLLGASARLRGGTCDARCLSRRRPVRPRGRARRQMGRCRDEPEGHARRARHPHARPCGGDRSLLAP